ncbi:DNA damage response protein RcaA [Coccidioides posadasii str. Silveira]|uniref:DNA damage response protein RcaA n=1 Tax=Coccidioides posadasii (strain RMSCC 757 / Silveira) TaxID=443226 RepID=E9DC35_COCPS|nr:DNA damage response protein RcaA [Coccidioides posadasii str. Silveira]
MWILSSDGDFLRGKRIWLKPGKRYLFGRVQAGTTHAINSATISRHHLVIEVGRVQQGDGLHIHARSKLTLTDQKSKCGTIIDGETIKGTTKELSGRDEYSVVLGRYPHPLKIKWCPVVLSFSFGSQEEDPLSHAQSRLEDLDIKTILPYVVDKTTHVVQKKRNTAKGLQALINGKHIVDPAYIEHLVYAATSTELEREEALCPLELDFDAAWPDPTKHLPPRGKETTDLPDSAYEPQLERLDVFEGYTFVFCDSSRFEELQGPITNGHGKALLFKVEPEKNTPQELIDYMTRASGNKGLARDLDGSGGVLLVQPRKKRHEKWFERFENEVGRLTGQRSIEPGEFLDSILRNNASKLYRPYKPLVVEEPTAQSQDQVMEDPEELAPSRLAATSTRAVTTEETQKSRRPTRRTRTQKPMFLIQRI